MRIFIQRIHWRTVKKAPLTRVRKRVGTYFFNAIFRSSLSLSFSHFTPAQVCLEYISLFFIV